MSLEEFRDLVARCGERPEGWPPQDRPRAAVLLDHSSDARILLQDYQALRADAAQDEVVKAPAGLAERIVNKALTGKTGKA